MKKKIGYLFIIIALVTTIFFLMPRRDALATGTDFEISMKATKYDSATRQNLPIENATVELGDVIDVFFYLKNVKPTEESLIISSVELNLSYDRNYFQYSRAVASMTTIYDNKWSSSSPSPANQPEGYIEYIVYNSVQTKENYTEVLFNEEKTIGYVRFTALASTKKTSFEIITTPNNIVADFYGERGFLADIPNKVIDLKVDYITESACYYSFNVMSEFYYSDTNRSFDVDILFTNNTNASIDFKELSTTFNITSDDVGIPLKYVSILSFSPSSGFPDIAFSPNISNLIDTTTMSSFTPFTLGATESVKLCTITLSVKSQYQGDTYLKINAKPEENYAISANDIKYQSETFSSTVSIHNSALDNKSSDASLSSFTYATETSTSATTIKGWSSSDLTNTNYVLDDLPGIYKTMKLVATPTDSNATVEVSTSVGGSCQYSNGYWLVSLNEGNNTIIVDVIAEDGITEVVYVVEVYIQASDIGTFDIYFDDQIVTVDSIFDQYTAVLSTSNKTFSFDIRGTKKISFDVVADGVVLTPEQFNSINCEAATVTLDITIWSEDKTTSKEMRLTISVQSSDTSLSTLGYKKTDGQTRVLFNDKLNSNLISVSPGASKLLFEFDITATQSGTLSFVYDAGGYGALALADNGSAVAGITGNKINVDYSGGSIGATPTDMDTSRSATYYMSSQGAVNNTIRISIYVYNLSAQTAYYSLFAMGINASTGIKISNFSTTGSEYTSSGYIFGNANGISGQYVRYKANVITTGYRPSNGERTFSPIESGVSSIDLYAETTYGTATMVVYDRNGKLVSSNNGYYTLAVVEGLNTYRILVTAGDGVTKGEYFIKLHCRYSSTDLDSIKVNNIDAQKQSTSESGYAGVYSITVSNSESNITILPTGAQNANALINGGASYSTTINELETLSFDIMVSSEDSNNSVLYKLYVTRLGNDDSSLSNVNISATTGTVSWNKAFNTLETEYDITLTKDTSDITFEFTAGSSTTTIDFDSLNATGSLISGKYQIQTVYNNLNYRTFVVTTLSSSGNSTTTYVFNVHKKEDTALSSATYNNGNIIPLDNTLNYSLEVSKETTKIDLAVKAKSDTAVVVVLDSSGNVVTSGLDISLGNNATFTVVVSGGATTDKFAAAKTTYTFTFTVKGESIATLDFLGVNSAVDNMLVATTLDYLFDLAVGTTSATLYFTRTAQTAKVLLIRGSTSIDVTNATSREIPGLTTGSNEIVLRVIAEDESTIIDYTIDLYVKGNENLDIAMLTANDGKYVAAIESSGSYRFNVASTETKLNLSAILYNTAASYTADVINLSQSTRGSITVSVGSLSKEYIINVTVYPSIDENHLKSIVLKDQDGNTFDTNVSLSHYSNDSIYRYAIWTTVPYQSSSLSYAMENAVIDSGWSFTTKTLNLGTASALSKVMDYSFYIQDETGVRQNYILIVLREAPSDENDATFDMLGSDGKTYNPTYNAVNANYTLRVPNAVSTISLGNITISAGATLQNNSNSLALTVGNTTTYSFVVTSQAGTKKTYQIVIYREYDDNTSLFSLFVTGYVENGTTINSNISLNYTNGIMEYTYNVLYAVTSVTIEATLPTTSTASISQRIQTKTLAVGNSNYFDFKVTSQNGVSSTYRVTVVRADRSPSKELKELKVLDQNLKALAVGLDTSQNIRYVNVPFETTSVYVEATSHTGVNYYVPNASLESNGYKIDLNTPTSSIGATTKITLYIVAEDETEVGYIVEIRRAAEKIATLDSVTLSTEAISFVISSNSDLEISGNNKVYSLLPNEFTYDIVMPNSVLTLDMFGNLTSSNATMKLTGPSGDLSTTNKYTYTIRVTAQDGETSYTYYFHVIRAKSNQVGIAESIRISRSGGTSNQVFMKNGKFSIEYEYGVSAVSAIALTPTQLCSKMVLRYGKETSTITSGWSFNRNFTLTKPTSADKTETIFYFDVYAEDGETFITYELSIYRKPDTNVSIEGFNVSKGSVSVTNGINTYYLQLDSWDRTVEFRVEAYLASNSTASITVGISKFLQIGVQVPFIFTVTAQDGKTTAEYRVYVTIYAESDAHLNNISIGYTGADSTKFELNGSRIEYTVPRDQDNVYLSVNQEDYSQYVSSITWSSGSLKNQPLTNAAFVLEPTRDSAGNGIRVETEITITVVAEDTVTKQVYKVYVYRQLDTENVLGSLRFVGDSYTADGVSYNTFVDDNGQEVSFDSEVLNYKVFVFTSTTSASIYAAVKNDSTAIISQNLRKTYEATFDLIKDSTTLEVSVLSENNVMRTYTITIVKRTNTESKLLSLTTTTDISSYSPDGNKRIELESIYSYDIIGFTYKISNEARLTAYSDSALNNPIDLLSISLEAPDFISDSITTFYINVISEDGSSNNTYTIQVKRLRDTDKTVSSPIFSPSYITVNERFVSNQFAEDHTYYYSATVINDIKRLSITLSSLENVRVSTSGSSFNNINELVYDLEVNVVKQFIFYVYSMQGSKDTYVFNITRLDDLPIVLQGFEVSNGQSLNEEFSRGNQNYTINVANNITSLTIRALTEDVSGITIEEGATQTKSLSTSNQTIFTYTVTYQGSSLTYNIIVTREKSTVATTSSITLVTNDGIRRVLEVQNDNHFVTYFAYGTLSVSIFATLDSIAATTDLKSSYTLKAPNSSVSSQTTIAFMVYAENSNYSKEYIVDVYVQPSANMAIKEYEVEYYDEKGSMVGSEKLGNQTSYQYVVGNDIARVTVRPILDDPTTQKINYSSITLDIRPGGTGSFEFIVYAQNGSGTYYRVVIKREFNTDKEVLSFKFKYSDNGVENIISPNYDPTNGYTLTVPYHVSNVDIDYIISTTATSTTQKNYVLGSPTKDANYIYNGVLKVVAQDGSIAEFKFRITRLRDSDTSIKGIVTYVAGQETPQKDSETEYSITFDYSVATLTADVVLKDGSTASVLTTIENETLNIGENIFIFVVMAQDGSLRNYKLTVTRNQNTEGKFERLFFLSAGNRYELTYSDGTWTILVPYSITEGTLSYVNEGVSYLSENATLLTAFTNFSLAPPTASGVGQTTVSVSILSQDGKIHSYDVVIKRAQDDTAIIDSMVISSLTEYVMNPLFFRPTISTYDIVLLYDGDGAEIELNASLDASNTAHFLQGSLTTVNDIIRYEDGTKSYQFVVVSQNGEVSTTYTFNFSMASNNANELFSVALDDGTELIKNPATNVFELVVEYEINIVSFILSYSPGATLLTTNLSGLSLNNPTTNSASTTVFTFHIEAQDGTIASYTASITRKQDTNTLLSDLKIDGATIDGFNPEIQNYTKNVGRNVTSVNIEAMLSNENTQSIEVISYPNSLTSASNGNVFRFRVTAQAPGYNRIYTVTVYREQSSTIKINSVSAVIGTSSVKLTKDSLGNYFLTVPYEVTNMSFALDVADGGTYQAAANYPLTNPTSSADSTTNIRIVVTAENGITKETVYIRVVRQRDTTNGLNNLYVSYDANKLSIDQRFNEVLRPDTPYSYTVTIPYSRSVVYVAAIAMADTQTISFADAYASFSNYAEVRVDYGSSKTIRVIVTAQNGTSYINEITITRGSADPNCDLLSLSILGGNTRINYARSLAYEGGTGFRSDIYDYTLLVDGRDRSVIINGTASKLASSVTGFGTYVNFPMVVSITIVAEDGIHSKTYRISLSKYNDDANLKDVELPNYNGEFEFDSNKLEYNLVVYQNEGDTITINPIGKQGQTIVGGGTFYLEPGDQNRFEITVTAEDGIAQKRYYFNVDFVTASGNTYLSGLGVDGYTLEFNKFTLEYEITTHGDDQEINISARPESNYSIVSGTGVRGLSQGDNVFKIVVTAQTGATRTYRIVVKWNDMYNDYLKDLSVIGFEDQIEFNPYENHYSIRVVGDYSTIDITATAQSPLAIVTGTGVVNLLGTTNIFSITVEAAKGFSRTYQLEVEYIPSSKDAYLSSLSVEDYTITPIFNRDTLEYNLNIIGDVFELNVIAQTSSTLSTIKSGNGINKIFDGENEIRIIVRSFEGDEMTYVIKVHLTSSTSNNYLAELSMEEATIAFDPFQYEYIVTIPQDTLEVNIFARAQSDFSIVSGIGKFDVATGENLYEVTVTSSLGESRTYSIFVFRPESNNALLDWMDTEGESLDFDPLTNTYDIVVGEETTNILVHTACQSTLASVHGGGDLALVYGENRFEITVTAEDGTRNTYILNVYRTLCSNNYLANLTIMVNNKLIEMVFNKETLEYEITISGNELVVEATVEHETATKEVEIPEKITSKSEIKITVTALDGTTRVYIIYITRTDFAWLAYIAVALAVVIVTSGSAYLVLRKKHFSDI